MFSFASPAVPVLAGDVAGVTSGRLPIGLIAGVDIVLLVSVWDRAAGVERHTALKFPQKLQPLILFLAVVLILILPMLPTPTW